MTFQKELEQLINKHSIENGSDTPDFILAEYMSSCLKAYGRAVQAREQHQAKMHKPIPQS